MHAKDSYSFNPYELERLQLTIETAAKVRRRHQLYLWAQGGLQSFLPHETLLCALGSNTGPGLRSEICSRALLDDEQASMLTRGDQSLLLQMAQFWVEAGCLPLTITTADQHPLANWMRHAGIERAACHGMPEFRALSRKRVSPGSFFIFLKVPEAAMGRYRYVMDLMLPMLHAALVHVCDVEGVEQASEKNSAPDLSERERQVLQWVRQGKTNHEIGQILSISPLTVKNHVQKILRKLNVSNRAQAAAKSGKDEHAESHTPRSSKSAPDGDVLNSI